jgi:SAM-dependent methyltransferase
LDQQTILTYDAAAKRFAAEWMSKTPALIQSLVSRYFLAPGLVMDVGAGTGRDVQWLREKGFAVRGVDASKTLLELARSLNPDVVFVHDSLPELARVEDASVDFVLCSAVLMHVAKSDVGRAVRSLLRIVVPGGRIICSIRPSMESSERESDGRLYTNISKQELVEAFTSHGAMVICVESMEPTVNERCWLTVVAQRPV